MDEEPVVGGLGRIHNGDETVSGIVADIKAEFERQSGLSIRSLEVLSYRHQVVAGSNYFVKVS